jgi:hypothetical protein
MKEAFILSLALGLALAAPAAANPLDKGSERVSDSRTVHHKANFANATALWPVSAVTMSQAVTRETDGLSRNDEDCNSGCIDH